MELNPRHLTLNNLFSGRLFRIPDYQRAYAWGSDQRNDLFRDIRDARHSGQDHFMATVVSLATSKRRIGADEYQVVEVVDGQQRLTTFVVLFKAIEKALDGDIPIQAKIKREMTELLVKGDDHSLVLLKTNHDGSNAFTNYLRKGEIQKAVGATASEQNLIDAMYECEIFVERWKLKDDFIELVALLRNKFSLIYHELTDESAVYRVFEVLNSRGLEVKWIDKLKSQLMALIFTHAESGSRVESLDEMRAIWHKIYRRLGLRVDLGDEALRFAGTWLLRQRPNRISSEEDAARNQIEKAGITLKDICTAAEFLKEVVNAVYELDANMRLRAVTRIAHVRFLAVAIVLRRFDESTTEKLLNQWERVSFRIFGLCGADTRHKVGDYVRLGYEVFTNSLSEDKISARIKKLGEGYSIEEVLPKVDWWSSYEGWTEELRYLLFRYDEYLAKKAGEVINANQWAKIWASDPSKSIEHIQPQSTELRYVHHLGNLTMLPPGVNSSLQHKSPKEKASTYKSCGLRATADVGSSILNAGWTEKTVIDRASEIVKFIKLEWSE